MALSACGEERVAARQSAPVAAMALQITAMIWVPSKPAAGMKAKSVRKAPAAAPAVLIP